MVKNLSQDIPLFVLLLFFVFVVVLFSVLFLEKVWLLFKIT